MRKLAIAVALASTALATPAVARDNTGYVGLEGGGMIVEKVKLDYESSSSLVDNGAIIAHDVGYDVDAIAGYDFGWVRLEGELGYKRAGIKEIFFDDALQNEQLGGYFDADGSVSILSGMVNALLDFGDDAGMNGYVGGGVGLAHVRYNARVTDPLFGTPGAPLPNPPITSFDVSSSDGAVAWQLIAGVRTAITPNLDLGVKYRLFSTRPLHFNGNEDEAFTLNGPMRTHSLLASLIYNFAAPVVVAPPPPPPPPPPATQTCPDGSVILATDVCPAPPPPPPPPPPAPERG